MILVLLAALAAPEAAPAPKYEVKKLAERIYELSADGGGYPVKVVASVGPDGMLLVDSGEAEAAPALLEALDGLGHGRPRLVINTHSHVEHLGGNAALAGAGATVLGHARLRERYVSGLYAFSDFPRAGLPALTFDGALSLHWNGEEIRLLPIPGAHDSSDTVVVFTGSRVAVVGALCMGEHFPSIDGDTADIRKYPEAAARLLELLPEDVTVVPAHAADCDKAQCRRFHDMLLATSGAVRSALAAGKDLEAMRREDLLGSWKSYESSYVERDLWLRWWVEALTAGVPDLERRPRPYGPLHEAYVAGGAEAALRRWSELRAKEPGRHTFDDLTLLYVGRRLFFTGRVADAVSFLERCVAEFPDGDGAARSHAMLGRIAKDRGERASASAHYRAYLGRFPADAEVREQLRGLEAAAVEP